MTWEGSWPASKEQALWQEQKAEEAEVGRGDYSSKPSPSDMHPPAKPHLLNFPKLYLQVGTKYPNATFLAVNKPGSSLCHLAPSLQKSDSTVRCTCKREWLFITSSITNKSANSLSVNIIVNIHSHYFVAVAVVVKWSGRGEAESWLLQISSID